MDSTAVMQQLSMLAPTTSYDFFIFSKRVCIREWLYSPAKCTM